MEQYVTLFDKLFLPQGLALHMSMERHVVDYTLWILCVDEATFDILEKLNLPNVRLLRLERLETEELLSVKPTRTKGEYCWTITPFAIRFVFEAEPAISRVTYLDADLWFRKNPAPIFMEFEESEKHVLITDHAYAPEYDLSATSGQYCVQFITFTREDGEKVRKYWEERCIEWCYDRFEDGKFGDQKYLDDWPERFPDLVHVLKNKELTLAPWNAMRFPYSNAIIWHFHLLRIKKTFWGHFCLSSTAYALPKTAIKNVYCKYAEDIKYTIATLAEAGFDVISQKKTNGLIAIINLVIISYRKMCQVKNNIKINLNNIQSH